jgi:hypothetical protein
MSICSLDFSLIKKFKILNNKESKIKKKKNGLFPVSKIIKKRFYQGFFITIYYFSYFIRPDIAI